MQSGGSTLLDITTKSWKLNNNNNNNNNILYLNMIGFKVQSLWGCLRIKFNQMHVFEERGKAEYPGKNLSEQRREPTNSTHIWHWGWKLNLGQIGGRWVLSPLRHHCSMSRFLPHFRMHANEQVLKYKNDWWCCIYWTSVMSKLMYILKMISKRGVFPLTLYFSDAKKHSQLR